MPLAWPLLLFLLFFLLLFLLLGTLRLRPLDVRVARRGALLLASQFEFGESLAPSQIELVQVLVKHQAYVGKGDEQDEEKEAVAHLVVGFVVNDEVVEAHHVVVHEHDCDFVGYLEALVVDVEKRLDPLEVEDVGYCDQNKGLDLAVWPKVQVEGCNRDEDQASD